MVGEKKSTSKKIALIGRARAGKSFLISRFVEDRKSHVLLFCGNSKDKTVCPINVNISESVEDEFYEFHSNFNSIYRGEEKGDSDLQDLNTRLSQLLEHEQKHSIQDIDALKEIESTIKEIRVYEEKYSTLQNSDTYIDLYQRPSDCAKKLLHECKLDSIEFTDTPGVSGKVEASRIAKSDIYVFVLKADNGDEAETLLKVVKAIKADVAGSKVLYVYKIEGIYSSREEYNEAREEVKEDLRAYASLFDDLRGSIVSTDLALLNPEKHCIAFPTMNKEKPSFQENEFMDDFMRALVDAFKDKDESEQDRKFTDLIKKHDKNAKNLVMSILNNIPVHTLDKSDGEEYTLNDFLAENHDRVLTKDHARVIHSLTEAYGKESELLYKYFTMFKAENYPYEWQQYIIKYIYNKLSDSARTDRGLGKGEHPWEKNPGRTMLVEESLLADQVLNSIAGVEQSRRSGSYKQVLIDNNISSASWDRVRCTGDAEAELKLRLVKECLFDRKVYSRGDLILFRYVGGLRLVAEYDILTRMNENADDIVDILKKLPF